MTNIERFVICINDGCGLKLGQVYEIVSWFSEPFSFFIRGTHRSYLSLYFREATKVELLIAINKGEIKLEE